MAPPPSTRWRPTPDQLTILEQLFVGGTRTPNASQIQRITDHLARYGKIECKNVFYWFQNHKAREKQKIRKRLFKQFQLQQQQQQWYQLQQQFGQATSPTLPPPPPPPPSSLVGLNHPFLYVVGPRYGCGNIFPGFPPQATDQERDAPSSNILDCLLTATNTEKPGAAAAPQPLPPPPPALPTLKPLLNINYYSSSNNNNNNNNKADDSWVTTLTTTTATSTDGDLTDYSSSSPTAKPALKTLQLFPTTSACSLKEEIINAKEAAAAAEGSHNNSQLTSCSTSTS